MALADHEMPEEESIDDTAYTKYTTFRETYKLVTFLMIVGLIYPNPDTTIKRAICIFFTILSIAPVSFMIFLDMYESWLRRDIINIIRHLTVMGPFLAIFFKILLIFYKRHSAKRIIDIIEVDYAGYNQLPPAHKAIVNRHIRNNNLYTEKCWTLTVTFCVLTFPVTALLLNAYNALFAPEPRYYMIHDLNRPFSPAEAQFESPYFEIMFVYMFYSSLFYIINYTGFDGFFGLCINHACLKMDLYCKEFEDAMRIVDNVERHRKVVGVIKDQNKMFQYVELIQDTFNEWLGLILAATMIQICNCMYHITEGYELDLRYIVFFVGAALHVYLPCLYASKLKDTAAQTATALYCGGWERVRDVAARRLVLLMLARAQLTVQITAFYLMVYDMDLFVSMIKTSYSMYTLLRS